MELKRKLVEEFYNNSKNKISKEELYSAIIITDETKSVSEGKIKTFDDNFLFIINIITDFYNSVLSGEDNLIKNYVSKYSKLKRHMLNIDMEFKGLFKIYCELVSFARHRKLGKPIDSFKFESAKWMNQKQNV